MSMREDQKLLMRSVVNEHGERMNFTAILAHLTSSRVLNQEICSELEKLTDSEQGWLELFRRLQRRGSRAFDELFLAVFQTGPVQAAVLLRPLVSDSTLSSLENDGWSVGGVDGLGGLGSIGSLMLNKGHIRQLPQLPLSNGDSAAGCKTLLPTDIYTMKDPRGHALIINNRYFSSMPERVGTDVDRDALVDLFGSLHYTLEVKENLSAKDMTSLIAQFCSSAKHFQCSSAVVVLLSHGEHDCVFGVDDQPISTHLILSFFNSRNAPFLAKKPKLVFLQACRGGRKDEGFDAADSGGFSLLGCMRVQTRTRTPAEADILVAYSTPPFHVSWRNSNKGSWFIQALCEVLREKAKDTDIQSMLTEVNNRVASNYETREGFKQIPEQHSRLTKRFFFFPPQPGPV